jgi:TetR/AcrR family transcriptional regulator, cholesterol catabolism regulator
METTRNRRSARTNDEMSAQTQEGLLAAAVKLFSARGYGRTSLQDIAEEAGLTKGALYYHFKSKEDILRRVHDEMIEQIIADSREALDASSSAEEALRRLIHVHLGAIEARGDEIKVFLRERRSFGPANWREIRERRREIEHIFVNVIADGQRNGAFALTSDPRILAFGVLGMICWATEWFMPDRRPAAEIADIFADMVINGLVSGDQPLSAPTTTTTTGDTRAT